MSTKKKNVYLSTDQRYAALQVLAQGKTTQSVADQFGCGRTQIQDCKKWKAGNVSDYESNMCGDRKRHKSSTSVNQQLEELVRRWVCDASSRRISLTGALIQDRARMFAAELKISDFKCSNGWLEKFLKRNNLVCKTMSGERGDVSTENVNAWKERLLKDMTRDIFNMDETGVFFKLGRRSTYCAKEVDCAGGKKAKDRISVALCASMAGEKIKPLVIGRSAKPRCFRRISIDSLPVTYRHNKKAWMNGKLFEEWAVTLNKKMKRHNRNILLFLDNASSQSDLKFTG